MHQFRPNLIVANYQGSVILFFVKTSCTLMLTLALRLCFHSIFHKFEQIMANLIFDFNGRKLWNESDKPERFKCLTSNVFKIKRINFLFHQFLVMFTDIWKELTWYIPVFGFGIIIIMMRSLLSSFTSNSVSSQLTQGLPFSCSLMFFFRTLEKVFLMFVHVMRMH